MNEDLIKLQTVWENIRTDNIRGARELLLDALKALRRFIIEPSARKYPRNSDYFMGLINEVQKLRNDMVAFENVGKYLEKSDVKVLPEILMKVINYLEKIPEIIGNVFSNMISSSVTISVLSRSSIVEKSISLLNNAGKIVEIHQLISRPECEGRLMSENLSRDGIKIKLYEDAAMGPALINSDIAVVGADAVSTDGYFLSKVGTYPFALLAKEYGIHFYVLTDTLKISEKIPNTLTPEGFLDLNEHLEYIPPILVTEFITERGIENPPLKLNEQLYF